MLLPLRKSLRLSCACKQATPQMSPLSVAVHEYKIHWGPKLRIYFGNDGNRVVMILAGGSQQGQQKDIQQAQAYWKEYLARKKQKKVVSNAPP